MDDLTSGDGHGSVYSLLEAVPGEVSSRFTQQLLNPIQEYP